MFMKSEKKRKSLIHFLIAIILVCPNLIRTDTILSMMIQLEN